MTQSPIPLKLPLSSFGWLRTNFSSPPVASFRNFGSRFFYTSRSPPRGFLVQQEGGPWGARRTSAITMELLNQVAFKMPGTLRGDGLPSSRWFGISKRLERGGGRPCGGPFPQGWERTACLRGLRGILICVSKILGEGGRGNLLALNPLEK